MQPKYFFTFLLLLITQICSANSIRYGVSGTLVDYSSGPTPFRNSAVISGWYQLDWDAAKFEYGDGVSSMYSGILTYRFNIDSKYAIIGTGFGGGITYFHAPKVPPLETDHMLFDDLAPLFFAAGFQPIEDLYLTIDNKQGIKSAYMDFFSVAGDDGSSYSGACDLKVGDGFQVPEPITAALFLLGMMSIFIGRLQPKH